MKIIERNLRNANEFFVCKSEKEFDVAPDNIKLQQLATWGYYGYVYLPFNKQKLIYLGNKEEKKLPHPEVIFFNSFIIVKFDNDYFPLIGGIDGLNVANINFQKMQRIDYLSASFIADIEDYNEFVKEQEPEEFLYKLRKEMRKNKIEIELLKESLTPEETYFHKYVRVVKDFETEEYTFEKKMH